MGLYLLPVRRRCLAKPHHFSNALPFLTPSPFPLPESYQNILKGETFKKTERNKCASGSFFPWPVNTNLSQSPATFVSVMVGGNRDSNAGREEHTLTSMCARATVAVERTVQW